jgi:hypothetical protein
MGGDKRPYNGGDGKKNKKAFYGRVSPLSVDRRVVVFPAAAKEARSRNKQNPTDAFLDSRVPFFVPIVHSLRRRLPSRTTRWATS